MKWPVKKASDQRKEIIYSARLLFLTKEYEKVTMQGVMDRLNIVKGTIYQTSACSLINGKGYQ